MNRLCLSMAISCLELSLGLSAALPATAGPDFDAIAHGRKLRDAQALESAPTPTNPAGPANSTNLRTDAAQTGSGCQPDERVPLLDHGPQAQTTPYLNRQLAQRRDAELQACKNRMSTLGRPIGSPDSSH